MFSKLFNNTNTQKNKISMDSRIVNKSIKKEIWSLLRNKGFTEFTSRTAWRYDESQIDVINFQSFNSYIAEGVGCTTYSFALNFGIYYKFFEKAPWYDKEPHTYPQEYQCHLRERLKKGLNQAKLFHPYNDPSSRFWEKDRDDTWYVKEDGSNLEEVINDAKEKIMSEGLAYFDEMKDLNRVIEIYEKEVKERGMYWIAADMISTLALQLGDIQKGINAYKKIMNNPVYIKYHENRLDEIKKKPKRPIYTHDLWEMAKNRIEMLESK